MSKNVFGAIIAGHWVAGFYSFFAGVIGPSWKPLVLGGMCWMFAGLLGIAASISDGNKD